MEAYSPELFRREGHALIDLLADHLAQAQSRTLPRVGMAPAPDAYLQEWAADMAEGPGDAGHFFQKVIADSMHLQDPRYMGHQVAAPAPISALAGLVSDLLNNGMAVYEMGPVANALERLLSELLAERLGMGPQAGGLLTSGGTLANLTALLTARAVKAPGDVWENGTGEPLAVMVSEEAHYCIDRAARIMGLGGKGVIKIPVDAQFRMRTDLLDAYYEEAEAAGLRVFAVVGSASSTSTGAYDDLQAIAAFCKRRDLWFHADGAHGAAVAFSPKYRHLIKGIELADSVVMDWHKLLMVPALATALLYRRREDGHKTFHQKAQYLWANPDSEDWFNSGKRTFECTKYMMSVKIYALLKTFGEAAFTAQVESRYDLARAFARMLRARKNFETAVEPESNIVCFRYTGVSPTEYDRANSRIRARILEEGQFYIVQTTLQGGVWLRVSLMNPLTNENDLSRLLDAIEAHAAE